MEKGSNVPEENLKGPSSKLITPYTLGLYKSPNEDIQPEIVGYLS